MLHNVTKEHKILFSQIPGYLGSKSVTLIEGNKNSVFLQCFYVLCQTLRDPVPLFLNILFGRQFFWKQNYSYKFLNYFTPYSNRGPSENLTDNSSPVLSSVDGKYDEIVRLRFQELGWRQPASCALTAQRRTKKHLDSSPRYAGFCDICSPFLPSAHFN